MANVQMGGAFDPSRDVVLQSGAGVVVPAGGVTTTFVTSIDVIATGTTGTNAAVLPATPPVLVNANASGASGAGVLLPSAACTPGALYIIQNAMTGALNIYAVGQTINTTTGTTAFALTATGNKQVTVMCTVAGTWLAKGNT